MSATIGSNLSLLFNSARSSYGLASSAYAQASNESAKAASQQSASTTVTLSDEAKAYLASLAADTSSGGDTSVDTLTADARTWFDEQYKELGISSAMLDGQPAVDLTALSREALSVIASNTQGVFTDDESAAATQALQSRFEDAIVPHMVIARHTGDYASLYDAALKYMDEAGDAERTTAAWNDQRQALVEGAAAARASFGKAPDTGNDNDPVRALLEKTTASGSISSGTDIADVAANARAMLDAQANKAKDNGTELVFDRARKVGQQVDFSGFDNRSLAAIVLNQGASFSADEMRAAKIELDQRSRASLLNALDPTKNGGGGLALLQRYATMSDEEKAALGVTDQLASSLVQNYRSMLSIQNTFGGGASTSLTTYL